MKIKIIYCSILSDHVLAMPEFTHSEMVKAKGLSDPKLVNYITSQKDRYGHKFKKDSKKTFGFDYTSNQGGVKVEVYEEPHVKQL
ncbi:hypothetical protein LCGC14_2575010 [marine sediment metagenome]|uniref:Uncharacterized protein n=1 Tax=marine sediment metagenome TaxID=412755 RepID=A0A0F9AGH5_9ZZZZ|nr:hypothetical protein [bacterium]